MTKKHYIRVAAILQAISDLKERSIVAQKMADMFAEDNPHFIREKFYNAIPLK